MILLMKLKCNDAPEGPFLALSLYFSLFAGFARHGPPNRSREYQTLVRAFRQEIRPHIDQEQARMVLDRDWLELLETQPASQK